MTDEEYISRALTLARQGIGRVSPNPPVGCVLVREGEVVGEGYHQRFGGPHAEVVALKAAGRAARGASAYITLEPCVADFEGKKTPPCTDALIHAGVARVVVAIRDPNPRVDGKGLEKLRLAGLQVTEGILAREAARLIRGFEKWVRTGRPYVIMKAARTSDNYVAASLNGKAWFTSPESRRWVHGLRSEVDAVLVGRRTALKDDPQLTVRETAGVNPRRVVLDTHHQLPATLRLFNDGAAPTLLFTARGESGAMAWGEQIRVPASAGGVDLSQALAVLGAKGITSLLVEGGPTVHRAFLAAGLVDEMVLFTATLKAELAVHEKPDLRNVVAVPDGWDIITSADLGGDKLVVATPREPSDVQGYNDHPGEGRA